MVKHEIYHAHSINGVFEVKPLQGKMVIGFNATAIKRFSVAVAYFVEGDWRLRYRIVVTLKDGVLCFWQHKTLRNLNGVYQIPAEFESNTALVIGISTKEMESEVKFRIFANGTGIIKKDFNGYEGSVKFDMFLDKARFDDSLKEKKFRNSIRFDRKLYRLVPRDQPDDVQLTNCGQSWCLNRLPTQNYRTNVYGRLPMLNVRIDIPNERINILDKVSGIFKVCISFHCYYHDVILIT